MSSEPTTLKWKCIALAFIALGLAPGKLTWSEAAAPDVDSPEYWRDAWKKLASRGKGFVVWESNRTGPFRIWHRKLDGSDLRQLSPDEKGRCHYCPHIAPDGKKLVYVSFPENRWQDGWATTPPGQTRPMHLINIDGTGDRVIVDDVRSYEEHRAAVWLNEKEVIYIDGEGVTQQLNITTGAQVALTRIGQEKFGWLVNPTKTFATGRSIWITFSPYDPITKTVTPAHIYGGCQPYFSRDGVWGFYMGGKGGPINRVNLATGKLSPILKHKDPRLPKKRYHAYTPMLSPNQRLFTFGVAPRPTSERNPNSDYDVFVARCNPSTIELIGKPVRYTFNSRQDRFPDAFIEYEKTQGDDAGNRATLADKKVVPKFKFRARLLARADIPALEKLGDHRSCLVVYEYETEKRDNSPTPARFRVAHWGILDRKYVGLDKKKKGELYQLVVEHFSHNPQLKDIPLYLPPLKKNPDIPFYFDPGR